GLARGRKGLLLEPGRARELLAVDRRYPGPGEPAASTAVNLFAVGATGWFALRRCLDRTATPRRAADDAIPGQPARPLPLVRHLGRATRPRLFAAGLDGGGHAAARGVAKSRPLSTNWPP